MNWDAIGAIGETVGALAVLVTLAYLAMQIRQSNRIGLVASEAEFRVMAQAINRSILELPEDDPFLEELLKPEPDFTPGQRAKAIMFARSLCNHWAFAESSYRNGFVDEIAYEASIKDVKAVFEEFPGIHVALHYLMEEYGMQRYADTTPAWQEVFSELAKRGYET